MTSSLVTSREPCAFLRKDNSHPNVIHRALHKVLYSGYIRCDNIPVILVNGKRTASPSISIRVLSAYQVERVRPSISDRTNQLVQSRYRHTTLKCLWLSGFVSHNAALIEHWPAEYCIAWRGFNCGSQPRGGAEVGEPKLNRMPFKCMNCVWAAGKKQTKIELWKHSLGTFCLVEWIPKISCLFWTAILYFVSFVFAIRNDKKDIRHPTGRGGGESG